MRLRLERTPAPATASPFDLNAFFGDGHRFERWWFGEGWVECLMCLMDVFCMLWSEELRLGGELPQ